ncbi:hypothetical protein B0H14DRAFT_3566012 [Mycena olivaceomarginata]|nr:hypothetical protein B0H14DRAFT_3566012 [Mycena olivaceomarginata]
MILNAVNEETGKIFGMCWASGISMAPSLPCIPTHTGDSHDMPRARRIRVQKATAPNLSADHKPIDVLKKLVSDDRRKWGMDLNAHGGENMHIFDISVDRLDQRKGVGSALLKFGTDSMARYPAFRKSGFREIRRLEVDLNDYADGVKWVNFEGQERGLGDIHFRHIKYEPKHRV